MVVVFLLGFIERLERHDLGHQRRVQIFASAISFITACAVCFCASEWVKIAERYCVPTSLPCRFNVVGSWIRAEKNTCRSRSAYYDS